MVPTLNVANLAVPWLSARATLVFAWNQLSPQSQRRLVLATTLLAGLSILDFAALLMMAAVGAIVVASISATGNSALPDWFPLDLSSSQTVPILGGIAAVLMALKTLVSWRLTRRIYLFTANREPEIANRIYLTYLHAPYAATTTLSRPQVGMAVGTGASSLMSALNSAVSMVADLALLLLLVCMMLLASPLLFIGSFAYFAFLAWAVSRVIGGKASRYGRATQEAALAAGETTEASIGFAPEIRLYGMADKFGTRLFDDQRELARLSGLQQVLFQAPRYILEVGVIVGFVVVATAAFAWQEPTQAAFTVALFTLSSARLVPALQRLNGSWGKLRVSRGQSWALNPVLELPQPEPEVDELGLGIGDAHPATQRDGTISLWDVGYRYPRSESWAIRGASFTIPGGARVALVGRTGSGKSTLAYLIAGLMYPTSGSITRLADPGWRSRLAVVPQDVYMAPDTIRNNIALPVTGQVDDDAKIWRALERAQVADVVAALPDGLNTQLGERGARVSGGEAQRLGLARALYREPSLLVLDEATSSLDAETERRVTDAIAAMPGECTVVTVAHRLATVRQADLVVYVHDGEVLAHGTFEQVARAVPRFAEAARLQGLQRVEWDSSAPLPGQ